ncbi:autophagy protein 5 [Balamuthia mandrillaris]
MEDGVDEQVRRYIWEGCVPVVFGLTPNEITTLKPPDPFYLMVPRSSFLPMVTGPVREHFLQSSPVVVDEMWLEYEMGEEKIPLKWHYPAGVLFDLLAEPEQLPWPLTVHFQGFPTSRLLRCPNDLAVMHHYMNVLKEANYLKHGDSSKVNALSREDHNDLWEGLITNQYERFWKVNKTLFPKEGAAALKNLPIRVVRKERPCLQEPISPFLPSSSSSSSSASGEEPQEQTLWDVLHQMLPELFPLSSKPSPSSSSPQEKEEEIKLPKVIIQGILPPLNTPILWLVQHCSHPDNFLYIVVKD